MASYKYISHNTYCMHKRGERWLTIKSVIFLLKIQATSELRGVGTWIDHQGLVDDIHISTQVLIRRQKEEE